MKKIIYTLIPILSLILLASCESDFGQFNRDNRPDIPLNFTNTTSFGFDPFIEIRNEPNAAIVFEMEIPAESGRTIREITAVGAGNTAITTTSLNTNYITAPIPGQGNRAVFQTTLGEFREKRPGVAITIPANGFAEIAFMFRVTLDNGEEIISMRTRARVRN